MRWQQIRTEVWAKSQQRGQTRGELLDEHTEQVLRRLAQLRDRFPRLAEQVGDDRLWHRLFWACFLHDIGKAAAPWQAYIHGATSSWTHRHEVASLAFLPWIAKSHSDDFVWIGATIVSHHRDANLIDTRYDPSLPVGDLALDTMFSGFDNGVITGLMDWFASIPAHWIVDFGFQNFGVEAPTHLPLGIDTTAFRKEYAPASVIQGLKSYRRLRSDLEDGEPMMIRTAILYRGLMLLSDRLGSAHADPLPKFVAPELAKLLPRSVLRDYQELCAARQNSVVVVAPTGSGKTEAALLWAGRQQAAGPHRHTVFYVLPYQASINAMHGRLESTLNADVGLLHGRSTQALYRRLLGDGYTSKQAERSAMLARNLARLQRPAVQVTTPYQLLRAAYRLKGYEVIWTALSSGLLVVDEIHAYDPVRLGLFLGLLQRLVRDWDVQVCAVTATMPSWLRSLVQESIDATSIAASEEDFASFRRHRIEIVDGQLDSPGVTDEVVRRVEAGEAVLVAANTVRGAQETWSRFRHHLGNERTALLHSRFTGRDRLDHESRLLARYGLGVAPRHAGVVVATQTIEVSLNLDFDTIYSEPAPLEALAQRFGRVNRKGRLTIAPAHVLSGPRDGQGIYDPRLVERTLAVLREHNGRPIDEAELSAMLDSVYGSDLAAEFDREVRKQIGVFEQFCLDQLRAFESDDALEDAFDELFDGVEVLPSSFEREYLDLLEDSPLEAGGLLAPISHRQLARLRREQRVRRIAERQWVVDVPYDSVLGLRLTGNTDDTA